MTTPLQDRDAGKYLDLAAVAADLRRQGAIWVHQDLLDRRHSSSMTMKATFVATRTAAERIVSDTVARAKDRELFLLGQIDDEVSAQDDDQHQTVIFMAIIDVPA